MNLRGRHLKLYWSKLTYLSFSTDLGKRIAEDKWLLKSTSCLLLGGRTIRIDVAVVVGTDFL